MRNARARLSWLSGTLLSAAATAAVGAIPGDTDADGIVADSDWTAFATCLGGPQPTLAPPPCSASDVDGDGDVDLADFATFAQLWHALDCYTTAAASSIEANDPQYDPAHAVDGDFLTRWSSSFADNQWLQVDFGRPRTFDGVRIHWETACASAYRLSVSNDALKWTQVFATTTGQGGLEEIPLTPQTARYLRVDCDTRATQWGNSIWELAIISKDNCYGCDNAGDELIEQLVHAMTLEEKVGLVYGETSMDLRAIPRLGIPSFKFADGPAGIRHGQATAFPAPIAMAATWDVELIRRTGVAFGQEYRNKGRHVWLGPCINIVRVPHGGRNFETYGEDPFLNGRIATAIIQGVQSQNVVACVKHLACNNQEYDRLNINIQVDERTLREIYLPAFDAAIHQGGAWAVMASYNRLNGPYATENSYLLTSILKHEWGFRGFVVSDWGAVHSTVPPANAGLDLEMDGANPTGAYWGQGQLLAACQSGAVRENVVDDKVRRILRAMSITGILQAPWPAPDVEMVEHRALVREIGRNGIVLLKNQASTLPLDPNATQTVAILGPNGNVARTGGGGSSIVSPYYSVSPAAGLRDVAGPNVSFIVEPGVLLSDMQPPAVKSAWLQPPSGVGHGLQGEYFANTTLQSTPVLTRIDPAIDFNWGVGSPGSGVPTNTFSVRWTGTLTVPSSGVYKLGMATDDGSRLYLDGTLLINDWQDHALQLTQVSVSLEAGRAYSLIIEYYENGGDAAAIFSCFNESQAIADAVAAAASADAAIVFTGLSAAYESEGYDRPTIDLDAGQVNLINAVAAVNPRTIVVIVAGSQVGMASWIDQVPAALQGWYLGQEEGHALADVLFGKVSPSGKLPVTFVRAWEDHPAYTNYPGGIYTEGLYVGYRHFDTYAGTPLCPFGHGLSYTTFAYSNLEIDTSRVYVDGTVTVNLSVQNTGAREGAEVVQVYVHDVASSVARPVKELKGFAKVALSRGETRAVAIRLDANAFTYYDVSHARWTVEPGQFEILVGSSSRDIRLTGTLTYP